MHRITTLRTCAKVASLMAIVLGSASASADNFAFNGTGLVTGPAQVFPVLSGLAMTAATSDYTFGGVTGWHVDKLFGFNVATLLGGGSFTFSNGLDSFGGTFTSSRSSPTAPTTDLVYTVTGGTGSFAGYVGSGFSSGVTIGNAFALPSAQVSFVETNGSFTIAPVPEPATTALLALGLGGVAFWARRGRQPRCAAASSAFV